MSDVDGHISYVTLGDSTYDINGNTKTNNLSNGMLYFTQLFRNIVPRSTSSGVAYTSQGCAVRIDSSTNKPVFYQFYRTYDEESSIMCRLNYDGSACETVDLDIAGHVNGACYDVYNDAILIASNSKIYVMTDYDSDEPTINATTCRLTIDDVTTVVTVSNIGYDKSNNCFYTAYRSDDTITMYVGEASSYADNGYYTATKAYVIEAPETENSVNSDSYAFVRQNICGFNGMIGLLWYRPDVIRWYSADSGEFITAQNLSPEAGFGIPCGELEDADVMEDGTIYLSYHATMPSYVRTLIVSSNLITNDNYGGERVGAGVGLTAYCMLSTDASFHGFADGSTEYPFRLAQEAAMLAMTARYQTIQIASDDETTSKTGAFGSVQIRKGAKMLFGRGSSDVELDLGGVDCLDGCVRFIYCSFTPLGDTDYTLDITANSDVYFYNCTFYGGNPNDAAYYGYVTGSTRCIFKNNTFDFDPDIYGEIYCSANPGIEVHSNDYSADDLTGDDDQVIKTIWYMSGGVLTTDTSSFVYRKCSGDGYLRGCLANAGQKPRFLGGYNDYIIVPQSITAAASGQEYTYSYESIEDLTQVTTLDSYNISEMYDNAKKLVFFLIPLIYVADLGGYAYVPSITGVGTYIDFWLNGVSQMFVYRHRPRNISNAGIDSLNRIYLNYTDSRYTNVSAAYYEIQEGASANSSLTYITALASGSSNRLINLLSDDSTSIEANYIRLTTDSEFSTGTISVPNITLGLRPLGLEF